VLIGKENCIDAVFYRIGPEMFIINGDYRISNYRFNFTV
jgi:hypothetical protein